MGSAYSRGFTVIPEYGHGGIGGGVDVGLIHKHLFVARIRVTDRHHLLKELKDLVEEGDGLTQDRQEVRQAEVGHLVHLGVHKHFKRAATRRFHYDEIQG